MMRCIIFLNGVMDNYTFFKIKDEDFVIVADGGMDHAIKMTDGVDLWLGDFDSYDIKKDLDSVDVKAIRQYDVDKDFTDGELAILEAKKSNYDEIVLLGALGGRRDHELANMMMLFCGLPIRIESENETIYPLEGKMQLLNHEGETLSIIPLSSEIEVTIEGVKFPLDKHRVKFASTHTMSNVIRDGKALIHCHSGRALVVVTKKV